MRRVLTLSLALVFIAGVAQAQELTSGVLEGTVVAQDTGDPIVGAVVTAVGPQGARTSVTDGSGRFTIRGLVAGDYLVKAESPGYSTIVQSDVKMSIGTRTQLPFTLPAGQVEEITVTSEAPIVDMKSTGTDTTVRVDDFFPYVPVGRNIVSTFAISPGVSDGGDIGAANQSISGASGLENMYFVDGVNITNSGFGALGAYSIVYGSLGTGVTYDFLEEVQVKTGGYEAEFGGAGGGIVSSVVRSGTNTWRFNASWYQTLGDFEGTRGDLVLSQNQANVDQLNRSDVTLSGGGPLVKDKFFLFAAYNPIKTDVDFKLTSGDADADYYLRDTNGDGQICDPNGNCDGVPNVNGPVDTPDNFALGETVQGGRTPETVTRTREINNWALKLSGFITPNHKLEVTGFGDPSTGEEGPQSPTSFMRNLTEGSLIANPATGATGLDYGAWQASFRYQGVFTSNFFMEFLYANKSNKFDETGTGTEFRSFFDPTVPTTVGGAGFYEAKLDETQQAWLKLTNVIGPVELRYGVEWDFMEFSDPSFRSGPAFNAFFPVVADGTDGSGNDVAIFDGNLCPDPSQTSNPNCYNQIQSTTGATTDLIRDQDPLSPTFNQILGYNVTRTAFEPLDSVTENEELNAFLQLTWDIIPNLTLKAGLRYTNQELTGSGEFNREFGVLPVTNVISGALSTDYSPKTYEFDSEIAPRIGISWDIMNNGKFKLYGNYAEYFLRVPSDLAVRQFSNEIGIEGEQFDDPGLSNPQINSLCWVDDNNDGVGDRQAACHVITELTGAEPGIILDGTQLQPGSDVNAALGATNAEFVSGDATKLPQNKEWLAGFAYQLDDYSSMEIRYINRELGRVMEDVQFASNEQIWNEFFGVATGTSTWQDPFPGHGTGVFGAYVLANPGSNVDTTLFPDPERNYDAWEFVYQRRFNNNWMAYLNYRYATLEGNYEGSFRNDNGQSDPFITSLFDLPAASGLVDANGNKSYVESETLKGQYIIGPLNTDRTSILNAFVSKSWDFGLNLGGRMTVRTGQPRFPKFAHPTYRNAGEIPGNNPEYWWLVAATRLDANGDPIVGGDGVGSCQAPDPVSSPTTITDCDVDGDGFTDQVDANLSGPRLYSYDAVPRDFGGRRPTIFGFDFHASYDLNLKGRSNLTFLLDVFNLFNDVVATRFDDDVENRPGVPNVNYQLTNQYNAPRTWRLGVKFTY